VNLLSFDLFYAKRRRVVSPGDHILRTSWANRIVFAAAVAALACGIFLRFDGLGHKLYTNDEATTSVHVSGHTIADYLIAAHQGRIASTGAALAYQHIDPATSTVDVVRSLALEDPQHPPLFYVLERGWETLAGTSVPARRALPALFGVLALLAAYTFGRRLLAARRFGLVLAALVAVSPFQILYAQQAREYSLWAVFVFATSAALLGALERPQNVWRWTAFTALTIAGLYTDVLYLYTLAAQALYVGVVHRNALRSCALPFGLAAGGALVAFSPWLALLVAHAATVTNNAYLGAPLPGTLFALKWLFNAGAVFFDLDYVWHATALLVPLILAFAAFGAAALLRRPAAGIYVLVLGAVPVAALLLPDLVHHESRSTAARYLVPAWIALETTVAFGIWTLLHEASARTRNVAAAVFVGLVGCGVASGAVAATRDVWWGDGSVAPIGPLARIIRGARPPVTVIFRDDQPIWNFNPMELANEVPPDTRLMLLTGDALPARMPSLGTVLLLDPSARLRAALATRGVRLTRLYADDPRGSDDLRAQRREASRARAQRGFVELSSSLWSVTPAKGL